METNCVSLLSGTASASQVGRARRKGSEDYVREDLHLPRPRGEVGRVCAGRERGVLSWPRRSPRAKTPGPLPDPLPQRERECRSRSRAGGRRRVFTVKRSNPVFELQAPPSLAITAEPRLGSRRWIRQGRRRAGANGRCAWVFSFDVTVDRYLSAALRARRLARGPAGKQVRCSDNPGSAPRSGCLRCRSRSRPRR